MLQEQLYAVADLDYPEDDGTTTIYLKCIRRSGIVYDRRIEKALALPMDRAILLAQAVVRSDQQLAVCPLVYEAGVPMFGPVAWDTSMARSPFDVMGPRDGSGIDELAAKAKMLDERDAKRLAEMTNAAGYVVRIAFRASGTVAYLTTPEPKAGYPAMSSDLEQAYLFVTPGDACRAGMLQQALFFEDVARVLVCPATRHGDGLAVSAEGVIEVHRKGEQVATQLEPAPAEPPRIEPTIGRILWYWPGKAELARGAVVAGGAFADPFAAQIAYVCGDGKVNLSYVDHAGVQRGVLGVTLLQQGEDGVGFDGYCRWMPYQIGQARKA